MKKYKTPSIKVKRVVTCVALLQSSGSSANFNPVKSDEDEVDNPEEILAKRHYSVWDEE